MKKFSLVLTALFCACCLMSVGLGPTAFAQTYTLTDLGTLGGISSNAGDLNSQGQIAGASTIYSGVQHAYLWENGIMQDLGTPSGYLVSGATGLNDLGQVVGYTDGQYQSQFAYLWEDGVWTYLGTLSGPGLDWSVASDINNNSQIVGYSFTLGPGGANRAWIWEDSVFTDLGDLGGEAAAAGSINEMGQVVGWAQTGDPGYVTHAFFWENGVMTDLGTLTGDDGSAAADINEIGQICGSSSHPVPPYFTTSRACLWEDGSITDLGVLPGYAKSVATGINESGKVIGYLSTSLSGGSTVPFLWEDGVMTDLNALIPVGSGWLLKSASDINNNGQIVCWGEAPNGQYHGCLLTPNPCMMITLTPYMPPIIVPALGGSFDFNIEVTNPGEMGSQGDVWCDVTLPNGSQFGPTIGPANLFLSPGFTINRDRVQYVPGNAPAGIYVYHGYIGTYPNYVCNQDSFTFEKLGTDDGGFMNGWENKGESFTSELSESASETPEEFTLIGAYPNPFNPTTTIGYALPEAARVSLVVYDVSGRTVATLANGYRDAGAHEVTFDASSLASGVYIYRLSAGQFSAVGKMILMK